MCNVPQHARSGYRRGRNTEAASVSSHGGGHPAVWGKSLTTRRREARLQPVLLLQWKMSGRRARVARPEPIALQGEATSLSPVRRGHRRRIPPSN